MNPARGEIWWAEQPDKRRPVLVLTRDGAISVLEAVLVAPVTTRVRGIRTELALDEDDGMPRPCAASFDSITVARKSALVERITVLRPHRQREMCAALRTAVDC